MSKLQNQIDNFQECLWTEDEIADWINTLTAQQQRAIIGGMKKAVQQGHDPHYIACKARENYEQELAEQKERNKWTFAKAIKYFSEATTGWYIGGLKFGKNKSDANDPVIVAKFWR